MVKATKETVNFWRNKIDSWKVSGLNRKEFCEKNRLNISTAAYWFRKLLREDKEVGFVEIKPVSIETDRKESLNVCVGG